MITKAELHHFASLEGIRFDQIETDYVIVWILYGLSQHHLAPKGWFFKGGTCPRHCYYPEYRFSEDIDFSCQPNSGDLDSSQKLLNRIAKWVQEKSGTLIAIKTPHTSPGDIQVEIPVEYNRGGSRRQKLPSVEIHLTFDEPILTEPEILSVTPRYPDLSDFKITSYSKEEIIAEKMRALLQQQKKWPRPRDLYDLWFILCRSGESFQPETLRTLFIEKCKVRQIQPNFEGLISENLKERNKNTWGNSLIPLMKTVPDFEEVWNEWSLKFHEIFRGF
ncbi:MAG: nucleotidyl transferase AbiEii/AbiGii toxin family protein [Deltaproteobacteria bacterium]|nr:nucleotidyl transferase AbiEii/AbiGii toxin family protein [Deltaproteobacteria bacterium]